MERNDRNRPEEPGRVEFPAAELRAAAVAGLGSIEDGAFAERFLADPRADGDALAIRALGALLLKDALDRCFGEPGSRSTLQAAARDAVRATDLLEADDALQAAYVSLRATVRSYQHGVDRFAAPNGELFPVRRSFLNWVRSRLWSHALGGLRPAIIPVTVEAGPPRLPEELLLSPTVLAAFTASVDQQAAASPDYNARKHGPVAQLHQQRVVATIKQVIARLSEHESLIDPKLPRESIRRAVRSAVPQGNDAALRDRVRTLAPDVCHGVLPILRFRRSTLAHGNAGEVEAAVLSLHESLIVMWEAELLKRVVGLVSDVLFEAVAPERITARCQWLHEVWSAYSGGESRVRLRCELLKPIISRLRTARSATTRSPYAEAVRRWPDESAQVAQAAQTVIALTVSMEAWLAEAGGQA